MVLAIDDLAGNSLQNGGDFGESNDYATIIVQDQLQTLIDTSALSLDLIDGNICPLISTHSPIHLPISMGLTLWIKFLWL